MANPVKNFLTTFLKALKDGMVGEPTIHNFLQDLAKMDCSSINETSARKLNLAMRKAGCATLKTPGRRDPLTVLLDWINTPLPANQQADGSADPNRTLQDSGQNTNTPALSAQGGLIPNAAQADEDNPPPPNIDNNDNQDNDPPPFFPPSLQPKHTDAAPHSPGDFRSRARHQPAKLC